ncbi:MAG: GNAT family N-acetyltransferase [Alphaproteobacteria bacterium]|nr:MAG: GNAT family N-acetyltransferase [Alphaproteobacteria bacterium]
MTLDTSRYPIALDLDGDKIEIRLMTPADEAAVAAFAKELPPHDLLFLRRNITEPKVLSAWARDLEEGAIHSLVAMKGDKVVGTTAVVRDEYSWSPHLGELRVLVASDMRKNGLGRKLIEESFVMALGLELEKLIAQMTVDQRGAIEVFETMGFTGEALLKDHVKDQAGEKHDIVILALDVARADAQNALFGTAELAD